MSNLNGKVVAATKWSALTEIVAKLVSPITNILLAHLLTPEAFGIVATLTMIITFAEIFTDAGFQKYLIQHEFVDDKDRSDSTNVAFWSNLVISLVIWLFIGVFCNPIAALVGNPGLGYVLVIACISIPLAAFSSIQMALYKRDLDFKTLFKVRIAGVVTPLLVTIPLAFFLRNFWALVIGTIAKDVVNAILLTAYSRWKPRLYYSFEKLKEMFSFSMWSMVESITIWLTGYIDVFIVGTMLSQHYLGLYKTASTVVGQIMGLITAATTPILFSALSRLQYNNEEFIKLFFTFQKFIGIMIIPMGAGIFCYRNFITEILLGNQWTEISGFVGWWGLTSAITIVLSYYCSEVYRAKGRPKLSVLAQVLHIIVLYPTIIIAVHYDFETLYISRSLVRLEMVLVNFILMYFVIKISPIKMIINIIPACIASGIMYGIALMLLKYCQSYFSQLLSIFICIIVYVSIICMFPNERNIIKKYIIKYSR